MEANELTEKDSHDSTYDPRHYIILIPRRRGFHASLLTARPLVAKYLARRPAVAFTF
jgi:hypothetical protein